LDIGCGYGSLVEYLSQLGFEAIGVDASPETAATARSLYPDAEIRHSSAEKLPFPDGVFQTVVLRDSLHHIVGEGDTAAACSEIKRVLSGNGVLIVFEPNPNWVVRLARFLATHKDPKLSVKDAESVLSDMGFIVETLEFYEVFGLALSGGYVGVRWVPNIRWLNRLVARLNHVLGKAANRTKLRKYVCWRYMISAQNEPSSDK